MAEMGYESSLCHSRAPTLEYYCTLGIKFYERRLNGHFLSNDKVRACISIKSWDLPTLPRFFCYQVKMGEELYALVSPSS